MNDKQTLRVWAWLEGGGRAAIKLLGVGGAALALVVVLLGNLEQESRLEQGRVAQRDAATMPVLPSSLAHRPGSDGRVRALPPPSYGAARAASPGVAASGVSLVQEARTGSGDHAVVFNGDAITYAITIVNAHALTITGVLVRDAVPEDALENILCAQACGQDTETRAIPEPLGGVIEVTVTHQVTWLIPSLPPGGSATMTFSATVKGRADGTRLVNQVFVLYYPWGEDQARVVYGDDVATAVRVRVETPGQASLSDVPTWFSKDMGGTLSVDWGDVQGDGDLELALGSSLGATVYRKDRDNAGQWELVWESPPDLDGGERLAYGVRWADFDNDGTLELVVVGNSADDSAMTPGMNYVYGWDGETFQTLDVFTSSFQLVRVAPGDYDGDGYVDLVVSTNGINPACPVLLYVNSQDSQDFFTRPHAQCVSAEATANIGPGDLDNDGDLDLALGLFPDRVRLFINASDGGGLGAANPFSAGMALDVDATLSFLPYDFAWGDYNGDGYLDLAAAFPLEKKVRVYPNQAGKAFGPFHEIRSDSFLTPLSIGWGDLNGDGRLDLATASSPPRVYQYDAADQEFTPVESLSPHSVRGQIWGMAVVDYDGDGDLDLTLSNRDGPSMFFTTFSPFLDTRLEEIAAWNASSVAWGDANGDGYLDVLFGAGENEVNSRLYYNDKRGGFVDLLRFTSSGFGPQSVAFGDADADLDLDLAFGTVGSTRVYLTGDTVADWTALSERPHRSIAWGDADDDGDLDLLVGADDAPNILFVNQGAEGLSFVPVWTSTERANTVSVAWGDYNKDRYLDFAVGNAGQPNQVYCNNRDHTFTLVWSSPFDLDTRSVAWADYDGDGDLDLAVGNYEGHNYIYQGLACDNVDCVQQPVRNLGCQHLTSTLSARPVWSSTTPARTTSLAWGDWDNDGDPDLAVGNAGQADQVYANLSTSSSLQLTWLWTSQDALQTTGLAWGDRDGDGDLDLAMSQDGGGPNGVYENTYVVPSHLTDNFVETMPLPDNPSYLALPRPGDTDDAYFFSSAELLSGVQDPIVEIDYKLFDPDGTRSVGQVNTNLAGDTILDTLYEFSVDGGGTWRRASPAVGAPGAALTTTRLGYEATFWWDAVANEAVSDDARFRISIVQQNKGHSQRASVSAISPPFRVRGLTCVWPKDPTISLVPGVPALHSPVEFSGGFQEGSGEITFVWDWGDGSDPVEGQVVQHTFDRAGVFDVRLTIRGEACPVAKEVFVVRRVIVQAAGQFYMPLVVLGGLGGTAHPAAAPGTWQEGSPVPGPVSHLWGRVRLEDEATQLGWSRRPPDEALVGYRVYRRAVLGEGDFVLLATLPASANAYVDETAHCGQNYYVTALNAVGESPSSANSYVSLPCQE